MADVGVKRGRGAGKKDPMAPKKPRSAYILFCAGEREAIKSEDSSPKEVMKLLGERWRDLPEADKALWTASAAKDRERWEQEMKAYSPQNPDLYNPDGTSRGVKPKRSVKTKRKKMDGEPKRGLSAYIFFGQEKRPLVKQEHPDAKSPQVMQIIGQMWRQLTDEEKRPYNERAAQDRTRYERERLAFESLRVSQMRGVAGVTPQGDESLSGSSSGSESSGGEEEE